MTNSITSNKKINKTVWCSLTSRFFLPKLSYVFLFLYLYAFSAVFFAPILFFFSLVLPRSFGLETKNQPSRAFDDKQVREQARTSAI